MGEQGLTRPTVLRGTALGILGAAALPAAEAATAPAARAAAGPLALTVDTAHPGHAVSPDLYGVFFEEINYAGDGGLYPELIRNRAFMDPATPAQWIAPADLPRMPGKFGSALQLGGGSPAQYVALPQGIVSGLTDFTIATWVNPAAIATWARVFDLRHRRDRQHVPDRFGRGHPPVRDYGQRERQRAAAERALAAAGEPVNAPGRHAVRDHGNLYVNGAAVATNTSRR